MFFFSPKETPIQVFSSIQIVGNWSQRLFPWSSSGSVDQPTPAYTSLHQRALVLVQEEGGHVRYGGRSLLVEAGARCRALLVQAGILLWLEDGLDPCRGRTHGRRGRGVRRPAARLWTGGNIEVKKLGPGQLSLTRGGEDVVPVGEPDALLGGGGGGDGGHGDRAVHAVGGAHHAPPPRSSLALHIQQG